MWTKRALLAGLVAVVSACGDDGGGAPDAAVDAAIDAPPTAADFEGMWLMTSLTVPSQGTLVTFLRDGIPQGLRADVVVRATGAATARLSVRQVLLSNGLLGAVPAEILVDVALEPGRWVLTDPDADVLVFTAARTGDQLVLTLDPDDPRLTATDPPTRIVLDKVAPWTTTTVGAWDLVSITLPSVGTVTAGACTVTGGGSATITMAITFTERLLFERVMTTTTYSDTTCTTSTGTQSSTQAGFVEEEGNALLRMWGFEDGEGEYQVFTMALAADVATLTRTACLPQPGCDTSAPTTVVVRRR